MMINWQQKCFNAMRNLTVDDDMRELRKSIHLKAVKQKFININLIRSALFAFIIAWARHWLIRFFVIPMEM